MLAYRCMALQSLSRLQQTSPCSLHMHAPTGPEKHTVFGMGLEMQAAILGS